MQNFDIAFELAPTDIQKIDSIHKKLRFNDSSKDFGYELFTDLDGKQKWNTWRRTHTVF